MELDKKTKKEIVAIQRKEITHYAIYKRLNAAVEGSDNKKIMNKIAENELEQYRFWKEFSKKDLKPNKLKVMAYVLMAKTLGLNFALKLMEKEASLTKETYLKLQGVNHGVKATIKDGEAREQDILELIDEDKMKYTDSMILGLNDGLVELLGGLAGFTFALQDAKLIAVSGLIMGIAGSLSMGGSEYLSTTDKRDKSPVKASIYTGVTYFTIVVLLIFPFMIFTNPFFSLLITFLIAVLAIAFFNYYITVAKNIAFKERFFPMLSIGVGVAIINFIVGLTVRKIFNIGS